MYYTCFLLKISKPQKTSNKNVNKHKPKEIRNITIIACTASKLSGSTIIFLIEAFSNFANLSFSTFK